MMIVVMTVITGLVYPLGMTGIAQLVFPHQANGSLIEKDGKVIGSELIGQNFTDDKYFHGRPSATTETDPNDADQDGAGALQRRQFGRLEPRRRPARRLIDRVKDDAEQAARRRIQAAPIPVDLVTTSASGLDPDITPAAAEFQVPRVAKARNLPEDKVRAAGRRHDARPRSLGILGEPRVNVLEAQPGARCAALRAAAPSPPRKAGGLCTEHPPPLSGRIGVGVNRSCDNHDGR